MPEAVEETETVVAVEAAVEAVEVPEAVTEELVEFVQRSVTESGVVTPAVAQRFFAKTVADS